jgi:(2Fe-2S) ferredoxin
MSKFETPEKAIFVCVGSKCGKRGGKDMCKELKDQLKQYGLKDKVEIIKMECTDRCKFAPVLSVQPANVWFKEYEERDAIRILQTTLQG